ncbi:MAG: DUF3352 domain-containing protein [Desulfococcaceae bacterium]
MKKQFVIALVLAVCALGLYSAGCSKNKEENQAESKTEKKTEEARKTVADFMPESTEFMLKTASIEKMYSLFSVNGSTIMGSPVEKAEEMKAKWGFNPLVLDELRANGFDTAKEIGLAADNIRWQENGGDPLLDCLILVPVTDGKKAQAAVERYILNDKPGTVFEKANEISLFKQEGSPLRGAVAQKEDYLFIAFNRQSEVSGFMTQVLQSAKSVKDTVTYQDVVSRTDAAKDIFLYANFGKIAKNNYETLKNASQKPGQEQSPGLNRHLVYFKDYEGAGISVDASQKDLRIAGLLNVREGSDLLKISQNIRFSKQTVLGLGKSPALLLTSAVNFQEYYRIIQETMNPEEKTAWQSRLSEFRNRYGVDGEKDILSNIEGNFNLGIYDGKSINMSNYNILATLGVKDGKKIQAVMDTMFQSLTPEEKTMIRKDSIQGNDAYVITVMGIFQICAGVKDNNFILAAGYPMFESAVSGNPDTGFLSGMEDKELVNQLKGDTGVFYVNIQELYAAANNFPFLMQKMNEGQPADPKSGEAMRQLEYMLLSTGTEGKSFRMDMTVKTRFSEPFFQGMKKLSEQMKPAEKPSTGTE